MAVPELRFKADDGSDYPELTVAKLDDLCEKIGDGLHGTPIYSRTGNYYFINGNNLENGKIIVSSDTPKVNDSVFEKNNKELNDSTILMSINGTIGKVAYYNNEKVMLGKSVAYFKVNYKCIKEYCYQLIQTANVQCQFQKGLTGSTIKNLGLNTIKNTNVKVPCLLEQQKIAEFLSTVDTVIEKQNETVSAWEERKKGVMQKLFSQEVRFKADDGSDFPEWEKKKINDVAYLNPKTGTIPNEFYYMDLGGVDRGSWRDKKVVLKEEAPSRAQRIAMLGDCFFQSVRPLNMGHYLLKNKLDKPVVASTGFIQMRMKKDICPDFIFQLLFDENFNKEVELRCTGQTYPAINVDGFSDIAVRVPCFAEQQKIADCLSSFDEVIENQKATLAAWEELKKGLLQQMFM